MTCAFSRLVAISVLFTFTSVATAAGPFDVVKTYRFIPRLSDVVESGGITGRQLDYSAWGKFDLNFGPEVSIPELDIHPSFENVASWLNPDSPLTYVLITDEVFGLSRLEGNYRRQNRIVFEGTTSQDTPVKMEATFAGRLLKLTGETHPACCDQFAYSMNAIAVTGPFTDFNFDGIVNTADYTVLRNHLGKSAGATMEQGDADGDGDVDAADYKAWKRDLGTVIDPMLFFEPPVISSAAVPEPAMTLLVFSAVLAMSTRIRRRGK
jgi:hypothetical protein